MLGFALAGRAALWPAIASDVGAMLLVTLNSMMLLPSHGAKTDLLESEEGTKRALNSDGPYDESDEIEKFNREQKE